MPRVLQHLLAIRGLRDVADQQIIGTVDLDAMPGKIQRRHVAGHDRIEELLPRAQEGGPPGVLRLDHLEPDVLEGGRHRPRVVARLLQLLVGRKIVVDIDADDERNTFCFGDTGCRQSPKRCKNNNNRSVHACLGQSYPSGLIWSMFKASAWAL